MQFIKQQVRLPIENIEINFQNNVGKRKKHGLLLPDSIRCIISGASNCGKTNVIMSLLLNSNGLRFKNVYIYSRSLHQPKYEYLKKILSNVKGIGYYTYCTNDEVIPPEQVKPNSIFIFDDVICDKQNNIRSYFCMGRHRGVDCFYLSQSFARIPKHLIRENANLIVLFKQDQMNLKHVYNDYCIAVDMPFEKFEYMCNYCWKVKYGFLVIDVDSEFNNGKYRRGFDEFIYIK